jgi:hypothetical protein
MLRLSEKADGWIKSGYTGPGIPIGFFELRKFHV